MVDSKTLGNNFTVDTFVEEFDVFKNTSSLLKKIFNVEKSFHFQCRMVVSYLEEQRSVRLLTKMLLSKTETRFHLLQTIPVHH